MPRLPVLLAVAFTLPCPATDPPKVPATGRVELPTLLVRPRLTGVVAKVLVKEGQTVKKGDPLAELDAALFKLDLDVAEAKLKQTEVEAGYARGDLERLVKGTGTPLELDRAKALADVKDAEVLVAKAAAKKAQLALDGVRLVAPADGRVDRVLLPAGSLVHGDDSAVFRLTLGGEAVVTFSVGEDDYLKLREAGMTAAAGFGGESGTPHPLTLLPNAAFTPADKSVTLRATLPTPRDGLAQGEPVRVELTAGKK